MLDRGVVSPARVSVALDDKLKFACFLVDAEERMERAAGAPFCRITVSEGGVQVETRDGTRRFTYPQQA